MRIPCPEFLRLIGRRHIQPEAGETNIASPTPDTCRLKIAKVTPSRRGHAPRGNGPPERTR